MIIYDNDQTAVKLILQLSGSVFPKALFPAITAAVMTFGLGFEKVSSSWIPLEIQHPFSVQIFAIILGYVIVFRTNMALGRYREGMTNIQQMISKWGDAFVEIGSFITVSMEKAKDKNQVDLLEELRRRLIHWFTLLSAVAMISLNDGEVDLDQSFIIQRMRSSAASSKGLTIDRISSSRQSFVLEPVGPTDLPTMKLPIIGRCTDAEKSALADRNDKVLVVAGWITEEITRACLDGLLLIPEPILSRCYQELSNGMLGYNQAFKVALVPFPFPFAQMVALLLVVFLLILPMMVLRMTQSAVLSPILSFFCLLGYWGLNEIAVELENPFGDDDNDLPLKHVHTAFVDAVRDCAEGLPTESSSTVEDGPPLEGVSREMTVLKEELERLGVPVSRHFPMNSDIRMLAKMSKNEMRNKFKSAEVASRMHRRVGQLVRGDEIPPPVFIPPPPAL
ncbi:Zinc finger, RAN-binding domain containing 2 [Perkinsus chesapeaki]|uniref:Zinc finger, RAN-binding domain containing 2 n=1 Tax=Perkinsus chesapeaki TaxID=330153 RepID=A0A7J6MH79_PERCH|nr:Zinc finger, RAN-binding domain containing 2 [Perkinsus chesapeaki]